MTTSELHSHPLDQYDEDPCVQRLEAVLQRQNRELAVADEIATQLQLMVRQFAALPRKPHTRGRPPDPVHRRLAAAESAGRTYRALRDTTGAPTPAGPVPTYADRLSHEIDQKDDQLAAADVMALQLVRFAGEYEGSGKRRSRTPPGLTAAGRAFRTYGTLRPGVTGVPQAGPAHWLGPAAASD